MPRESECKALTRHSSKTVYILGAGFSKGMGMPLLRDFIPEGLKLIKGTADGTDNKDLAGEVEEMLREYRHAEAYLGRPLFNLEDLFCLVDLNSYAGNPKERSTLIKFIYEAIRLAHEKHLKEINEKSCDENETDCPPSVPRDHIWPAVPGVTYNGNPLTRTFNVCAYEAFLSIVLGRNALKGGSASAIITLNYDLLLEQKICTAFENVGIYYGFDLQENKDLLPDLVWKQNFVSSPIPKDGLKQIIPIYKLHGSLNWQAKSTEMALNPKKDEMRLWFPPWFLKDNGVPAEMASIPGGSGSATARLTGMRDPSEEKTAVEQIPLVPPTWRKSGAEDTVYGELMRAALRELQEASEIVIIGYSMPITDAYFKYLLVEAFSNPPLPKISVWDVISKEKYERNVADMFGSMIAKHLEYHSGGFIEYVRATRKQSS